MASYNFPYLSREKWAGRAGTSVYKVTHIGDHESPPVYTFEIDENRDVQSDDFRIQI
jgi:hypothetical protein